MAEFLAVIYIIIFHHQNLYLFILNTFVIEISF
jgi:hypothetical protein